jgi:dCMP deaminase
MSRPDRDTYWFRMAAHVATRATCPRASIGAILVKFDRQIGAGFNGAPEGEPHCDEIEPLADHLALEHCERARHAEINALRNALLPPFGATLYVVGPRPVCVNCADRLREAGVSAFKWRATVPSLDTLARAIAAWQAVTFPQATPASVAEHLKREAVELAEQPSDPEELADLFHLLVAAAEANGYDLIDVVSTKFAVNKARRWGKPDAAGVVEHLKEVTP